MITRRRLIELAAAGGVAGLAARGSTPARGQVIRGPARLLVGFTPGGALDVVARLLAERMKGYSSAVVVDNRPGAGGRIALSMLKAAPTDGSVMVLTPASMVVIYPHVYKVLGYDPVVDFTPVTTVCSFPFLITVGPMVPTEVRTLADFAQWCRANPKQAAYGTAAAGSMLHFAGVIFATAAGVELLHVPYGGPNGIQDLSAGRIAATIYPIGTALPHVQSGSIRALATTGPQRAAALPDVPTVREAGYPMLEITEWFGVLVPAKIPADAVDRLHDIIINAVETDGFRDGLAKLSLDPVATSRTAFATLLKADLERWRPVIEASGFNPEN
jgi:tripartite-type tricarboxylate transporter receptor subunit TctC